MNDLEAARQLVLKSEREAPSVGVHLPELRTPIKWKASEARVSAFRSEAFSMAVWCYGIPFAQIDGFHDWLATNEIALADQCRRATNDQVQYLGTYLSLDTGAPRYQTFWGFKFGGDKGDTSDAEDALGNALAPASDFPQLRDLVKVLRSYWTRDGAATDLHYGQARHYTNLDSSNIDSCFWNVTRLARNVAPIA